MQWKRSSKGYPFTNTLQQEEHTVGIHFVRAENGLQF